MGNTVPSESADSHTQITPVTRRDIFDRLRAATRPWHGRLDEIDFLEGLDYDLRAMPSTDSRPQYPTAREDIIQHRLNNLDWDDDWVFEDPRFGLLDGPDEVLMAFLARTVHPEVQADTGIAARDVDELNRLLAPDGWMLRASEFISGRPVYTPFFTGKTAGPSIPLPILDDDASKLDLVLGQTHLLLDARARGWPATCCVRRPCSFVRMAATTTRRRATTGLSRAPRPCCWSTRRSFPSSPRNCRRQSGASCGPCWRGSSAATSSR